jgi:hypothetical protein
MLGGMKTKITKKQAIIGAVVLIVALLALWYWNGQTAVAPAPVDTGVATTTDDVVTEVPVSTVPKPKTLPPEPAFTLPAGATALDDYAFILDGQVYFRSITSGKALAIPNSDADSFTKLSPFTTLPGQEVVSDCGVSGSYGYYADDKNVYFYQFWRAPKFRSSTVEVVVGADEETFKVTGVTTATDNNQILKVSYEKATTTCKYILSKVSFVPVD